MPSLKMLVRDLVSPMAQVFEIKIVGEVAEGIGRLWEVYGCEEANEWWPSSQFLLWRSSKPFSYSHEGITKSIGIKHDTRYKYKTWLSFKFW